MKAKTNFIYRKMELLSILQLRNLAASGLKHSVIAEEDCQEEHNFDTFDMNMDRKSAEDKNTIYKEQLAATIEPPTQ